MATGKPKIKPQKPASVFEQHSEDQASNAGSLDFPSASDLEGSDIASDPEFAQEEEEERPKYAQFMHDSEDEHDDSEQIDSEDEQESVSEAYSSDESSDQHQNGLQQQIKKLPFSALIKARQQLDASSGSDDEDDQVDISDLEEDEFEHDRKRLALAKAGKQPQRTNFHSSEETLEAKRAEVRDRLRQLSGGSFTSRDTSNGGAGAESRQPRQERRRDKERKDLAKRINKNAPTEISSKRPVSRRRSVVETPSTTHIRDPRFESLSGSVNKDLFSKSYSFLPEMFKDELSTLKKTLAKLKKQEHHQAGPKAKSEAALAIREERAKVEAALRRAEGLAGERERRARESAVKGKIKASNKERVEKGLTPFYPKQREIKQMLLKDKYERLSGNGNHDGKRASGAEKKQLKKALERRRRKNAQKEKKDMPVGIGFARDGNAAVPKRKREWGAASASGSDGGKRSRF
ncbi:related to rRNA biogenesis protein RRP36 [Melanopsichium pennsylvanicum]|uniref:rRNA biogenesis protein RRP36 n=2 Tax=Melanopsichium pennsylvanicum TaxID=63383 RepID=A0AAJ4XG65_9BASI|nr:rrna processing protein duf947 family [Melanopsichium pennsylvanicum 4]SNX81486.1 related to rRNA biogenesis protein RRP36 [Melanopsichium pennsylvanicum]